jgi:hypothetical protein
LTFHNFKKGPLKIILKLFKNNKMGANIFLPSDHRFIVGRDFFAHSQYRGQKNFLLHNTYVLNRPRLLNSLEALNLTGEIKISLNFSREPCVHQDIFHRDRRSNRVLQ